MAKEHIPEKLKVWIEARKRFHLSHAQVQMARELGLNPKKFGKLANQKQEPWKAPLPQFIEHLYWKRFRRERPEVVMSIEEKARDERRKKLARKEARRAAPANRTRDGAAPAESPSDHQAGGRKEVS
jgi:hypothetical protein